MWTHIEYEFNVKGDIKRNYTNLWLTSNDRWPFSCREFSSVISVFSILGLPKRQIFQGKIVFMPSTPVTCQDVEHKDGFSPTKITTILAQNVNKITMLASFTKMLITISAPKHKQPVNSVIRMSESSQDEPHDQLS